MSYIFFVRASTKNVNVIVLYFTIKPRPLRYAFKVPHTAPVNALRNSFYSRSKKDTYYVVAYSKFYAKLTICVCQRGRTPVGGAPLRSVPTYYITPLSTTKATKYTSKGSRFTFCASSIHSFSAYAIVKLIARNWHLPLHSTYFYHSHQLDLMTPCRSPVPAYSLSMFLDRPKCL